jgi:histidinol-phosphate aminotransferase
MLLPNEHLLRIQRSPEHTTDRGSYVRLDKNERVSPLPPEIFHEVLDSLDPEIFCAYPDPLPLYQRLCRDLGLPQSHLYLTNGSDSAIRATFQAYLRPGDAVILPDPTYAMYPIYTAIYQGRASTVPYSEDRHLDVEELFRLLYGRPRILAIPNPDQPTGAVLSESIVQELAIAAHEVQTLLIIDEAYYPFYPQTALELVRKLDNVVVTRTFSKVSGLAGLRLGYVVSHPDIINNLQRVRGAHEVNSVAIAIGSYILDHPEIETTYAKEVTAGREILLAAAEELGLECPYCPTNFQLVKFTGIFDTSRIVEVLKDKGYLVRGSYTQPSVRSCIRVTVGGPDVMLGFVRALRAVVSEVGEANLPK